MGVRKESFRGGYISKLVRRRGEGLISESAKDKRRWEPIREERVVESGDDWFCEVKKRVK